MTNGPFSEFSPQVGAGRKSASLLLTLFMFSPVVQACFTTDPPVANDDPFETTEANTPKSLDVLVNDSNVIIDPDCPSVARNIISVMPTVGSEGGTISVTGTTLFYTPPANKGSITETFTYEVEFTSPFSQTVIDPALVTVSVGPLPAAADAVDDEFSIDAGSGAVEFDVLANDSGTFIFIDSVTQGTNGGSVTFDGEFVTYTPPANFPNAFIDTFTYTIDEEVLLKGKASTIKNAQDTATVTVRGPDVPPVVNPSPVVIAAQNDRFQINASQGRVELDVLGNDEGENIFIDKVSGNIRGRAGPSSGGKRVAYQPPPDLIGTITEVFKYSISNALTKQQSRTTKATQTASATVSLIVVGRNPTPATPAPTAAPLQVPTSSIGKIKSDLPVARAVENLCDLLTFRNDPRSPGSLNAEQQDLRNCACAIVNDPNTGQQRNAINQISGGQHQFSDTLLRFAKANSSIIVRRLSELRRIATDITSSPISQFDVAVDERLVKNDLWRNPALSKDALNAIAQHNSDRRKRNTYLSSAYEGDYDEDAVIETIGGSIFNTLSVGSSTTYMSFPLGGAAGDEGGGLLDSNWGMFVSVSSGTGDGDDAEFEFDFDSYDISLGIDKMRPGSERTWVFGGAVNVGKVETDAANSAGSTNADSIGVTLYSSLFKSDGWYFDAALDISKSDIDIDRNVKFTASGKNVFQTSSGDTEGDELGLSLGVGKEFNFGANSITTNARLQYIDGSIDGLTETIRLQDSGLGLALETDDFDIESFRSEIGVQINRAISTKFGVVLPYIGLTWVHEFEDRGSDIQARFVADPFSDGFNQLEVDAPGGSNRPTLFLIPGDENDSNYARIALGTSLSFANGKSAWFSINTVAGLESINSTQFTAGFRWAFGN